MCVIVSIGGSPGRLFDFHVLDMIELGIEKYVSLSEIKVNSCSSTSTMNSVCMFIIES